MKINKNLLKIVRKIWKIFFKIENFQQILIVSFNKLPSLCKLTQSLPNRNTATAVAYAGKNFGGVQGYGRPSRGPGDGARPRTPENFRKFAKKFLKKIAKNALF